MSKPSESSSKPPDSTSIFDYLPRVSVRRYPVGSYSPRVDERCITYCAQSSGGRTKNAEPWCRSICLRSVKPHEVAKQKIVLPPEGQPEDAISQGQVGGVGAQNVKHWQEGWYLWTTKSRWASQERLDVMSLTLPQQLQLMRRKEFSEKQRLLEEEERLKASRQTPSQAQLSPNGEPLPPLLNFSEFTEKSRLIALSPLPSELYNFLHRSSDNLVNPTNRALEVFYETFESGAPKEVGRAVWEKAKTGETFGLVKDLVVQTWERWKGKDDDDKSDE